MTGTTMPAVGVATEFAPKPTRLGTRRATQGTDSGNDRTRTFTLMRLAFVSRSATDS
jgi:hypothetical protein